MSRSASRINRNSAIVSLHGMEPRVDLSPPLLLTFSPADGAIQVAGNVNILLQFNEAIRRGSGTISIRSDSPFGRIVESFNAATSSRISFNSNNEVIIDPSKSLALNRTYFVVIPAGTFRDIAGNNLGSSTTFQFKTIDTLAPQVVAFSPADGASSVNLDCNLFITFNEAIQLGSGSIVLRAGSPTGPEVESFDAANSTRLNVTNNQLTIDPSNALVIGTEYAVTFTAGTIKDLAGNDYAGSNTYNFNTSPFDPLVNPYYSRQWHLRNTGQGGGQQGVDANVEPVWSQAGGNNGILGRNVTIAVVDDGLQRTHPDLQANYVASASYDFNFNDSDPSPSSVDSHGTAVAGVAAAVGGNGIGVTGVAPLARLAGIRLIAGASTDAMEASALNYQLQLNSIYSNSWGPNDTGTDLSAIGPQTRQALLNGVTTGRNSKGAIYTWAGGNGAQNDDNSNYDGYANCPYVIAVGAIDNYGKAAYYSEPGANLLVSAPSSGGSLGIVTTDLVGKSGYNGLTDTNYTNRFGGTSSATPLVSGVIALMLEANPALSWRDVMHILVQSSSNVDNSSNGWQTNGAGHTFHHSYGHGMVDANAAVTLARTWVPVQGLATPITTDKTVNLSIPDNGSGSLTSTIAITDNLQIESVEIRFNATHSYRGDLEILLTSPSGSTSVLATLRDDWHQNYNNWTFSSRLHWGELSQGNWILTVTDRFTGDVGTLLNWGITINGTAAPVTPQATATTMPSISSQPIDVEKIAAELISPRLTNQKQGRRSNSGNRGSDGLVSDPLTAPMGAIDQALTSELPHLDAYITSIHDWVATRGEEVLRGVNWTIGTYKATNGPGRSSTTLDAITGLSRVGEALPNGSRTIDTMRATFRPEMAPDQIASDLAKLLGGDIAFYFPEVARQQTPKSELPWIDLGNDSSHWIIA